MLKLLVDENLPRTLTKMLREAGHTVWDLRELGLRGIPDDQVFKQAQELEAVLLSADKGFGNLLRFPLGRHHGIVVVRFPVDAPISEMCEAIVQALGNLGEEDLRGRLCVLRPGQIRIRPPKERGDG